MNNYLIVGEKIAISAPKWLEDSKGEIDRPPPPAPRNVSPTTPPQPPPRRWGNICRQGIVNIFMIFLNYPGNQGEHHPRLPLPGPPAQERLQVQEDGDSDMGDMGRAHIGILHILRISGKEMDK